MSKDTETTAVDADDAGYECGALLRVAQAILRDNDTLTAQQQGDVAMLCEMAERRCDAMHMHIQHAALRKKPAAR